MTEENLSQDSDLIHISISINENDRTSIEFDIHDDIENIINDKISSKNLEQKQGDCLKNYVFAWINKIRAKKNHKYFAKTFEKNPSTGINNQNTKDLKTPLSNKPVIFNKITNFNEESKKFDRKNEHQNTVKESPSDLNLKKFKMDSAKSLLMVSGAEGLISPITKVQTNGRNYTIHEESYDSSTSKKGEINSKNLKKITNGFILNEKIKKNENKFIKFRSYREIQTSNSESNGSKNSQTYSSKSNKKHIKGIRKIKSKIIKVENKIVLSIHQNVSFSLIGIPKALKIINYQKIKNSKRSIDKIQMKIEINKRTELINQEIVKKSNIIDETFKNERKKSRNVEKIKIGKVLWSQNQSSKENFKPKIHLNKDNNNLELQRFKNNFEDSNLSTSCRIFNSQSESSSGKLSRNNTFLDKAKSTYYMQDHVKKLEPQKLNLLKEIFENLIKQTGGKYENMRNLEFFDKNRMLLVTNCLEEMYRSKLEFNFQNFFLISGPIMDRLN